MMAKLGGR
jgi:hypothetical protein